MESFITSPNLNTLGLGLDIAGVLLLFFFGLPPKVNRGGVGYLVTRRASWDILARTATGTGVLWATVVLTTGPIWARSAWGTWWTWEPRLTTSLIAWLIYIGALLVRRVSHDPDQGARLGILLQNGP